MRRASEQTTRLRVFGALVFAFALPSLMIGQAFCWLDKSEEIKPTGLVDGLAFTVPSLMFGVLVGWPYVLGAAGVWAILDHLDRHYWWTAALTGLATGGALATLSFRNGQFQNYPIAYPLCLSVGLITGLGVWTIAYGRQHQLPTPVTPAGRLVM